jgi:hypothetical protein
VVAALWTSSHLAMAWISLIPPRVGETHSTK